MKTLFCFLFFIFPQFLYSQNNLPYKVGEFSDFDIYFGGIKVGVAEMEVVSCIMIDSISAFHIIGKGKTTPFFDWFFKVRDVYETFIDTSKKVPLKFIRDVSEGNYKKEQVYIFNHNESFVKHEDTIYKIPFNSQDMLSALFYVRTFPKQNFKKKSFFIPVFMDEENYFLEIMYLNNEVFSTRWGGIDCMVFKPRMQEGRVFEDGEDLKIWISDDENRILVAVETKIWAGTIKAVLVGYENLIKSLKMVKLENLNKIKKIN